MEILYLLIPLSVVLVLGIVGILAWALSAGQFDDLEHQAELVFDPEEAAARADAMRQAARDKLLPEYNSDPSSPPSSSSSSRN